MAECFAKSISDINVAIQYLNRCDSTDFGQVMAKMKILEHFPMYKWDKFMVTLNSVVEKSLLCP